MPTRARVAELLRMRAQVTDHLTAVGLTRPTAPTRAYLERRLAEIDNELALPITGDDEPVTNGATVEVTIPLRYGGRTWQIANTAPTAPPGLPHAPIETDEDPFEELDLREEEEETPMRKDTVDLGAVVNKCNAALTYLLEYFDNRMQGLSSYNTAMKEEWHAFFTERLIFGSTTFLEADQDIDVFSGPHSDVFFKTEADRDKFHKFIKARGNRLRSDIESDAIWLYALTHKFKFRTDVVGEVQQLSDIAYLYEHEKCFYNYLTGITTVNEYFTNKTIAISRTIPKEVINRKLNTHSFQKLIYWAQRRPDWQFEYGFLNQALNIMVEQRAVDLRNEDRRDGVALNTMPHPGTQWTAMYHPAAPGGGALGTEQADAYALATPRPRRAAQAQQRDVLMARILVEDDVNL